MVLFGVMLANDLHQLALRRTTRNPGPDGVLRQLPDEAYWTSERCDHALVDLSWDGDEGSREYTCESVLAQDADLDYALLRVRARDDTGPVRGATIQTDGAGSGSVRIIHHPLCKQKQVTESCNLRAAQFNGWRGKAGVDFTHDCDTEGGIPGLPSFNAEGRVIGIHHHGFGIDAVTCQPKDKNNKAVQIRTIIEHILERKPELEKRFSFSRRR